MELIISLTTKFAIYAIFILSMNNFIFGKTGYWVVGHITFFAIGALSTGIFTVGFEFDGLLIYIVFFVSIAIAGLLSLIPALSVLRLRGDFFLFISIALTEMTRVAVEIISGPSGFSDIPRPPGLNSDISIMIVSVNIFILILIYTLKLKKHSLNLLNILSKTHEHSAISFGINVPKLRIKMFILGGAIAGAAGSLFAFYSTGNDPMRFNLNEAIIIFALVIIGGVNSIRGTIIAVIFYVITVFVLDSLLTGPLGIYAPKATYILFGLLLIIAINFMPKGLMGEN